MELTAGRIVIASASSALPTGTLFLDQIGEMPMEFQSRLLRVLQSGDFNRVGSARSEQVDVRVIAATNRDLESEVEQRRFREDLYFRLSTVTLKVPPLRERKADIVLLADHFLRSYAGKRARRGPTPQQRIHTSALGLSLSRKC